MGASLVVRPMVAVIEANFNKDLKSKKDSDGNSTSAFTFRSAVVETKSGPSNPVLVPLQLEQAVGEAVRSLKSSDGSISLPYGWGLVMWVLGTTGSGSQDAHFTSSEGVSFKGTDPLLKRLLAKNYTARWPGNNKAWYLYNAPGFSGGRGTIEYSLRVRIGGGANTYTCDPKIVNQPEPPSEIIVIVSQPTPAGAQSIPVASASGLALNETITGEGIDAGTTISGLGKGLAG